MIWEMIRECQINLSSNAASLDDVLNFPNKEAKDTLVFVFNQLGEIPEAQTEATVEATEQPEAELKAEVAADVTEQLESQAVIEEEIVAEEAAETEEAPEIDDAVFSYALEAETAPEHEGYLGFSLADPAVKFAVSYRILFIYMIDTNLLNLVLQTLLPNHRPPHAGHLRLQGQNRTRRDRTRRKDLLPSQKASDRTTNVKR